MSPVSALIIDDDPNLLELAKAFLEHNDEMQVETTASPLDALVLLETNRYDVIVCDYQMPDADGIQFLKTLRMQGRDTPFILFTGKGREDIAIDALNNGADFYLQKGGEPKAQFAELRNMVMRSVAERRAMESVKESEEIYEKLFKDNIEAMILFDRQTGRLEDVNAAACGLFGADREALLRMTTHDLGLPLPSGWERKGKGALEQGTKTSTLMRALDGRVKDVEAFSGTLKVRGRLTGYSTLRDTTIRKQAEDMLWKAGGKLRAIIEASPLAILTLNPDGTVATWNPAAEKVFGWEPPDPTSPGVLLLDQSAGLAHLKERILRGERLNEEEVSRPGLAGIDNTISISTAPIVDADGKLVSIMAVASDITERKRIESRLLQMNEALRLINGILRHDTLNELTVVSGSLDMFERTRQEKYLASAFKAVNRSTELIKRMKELEVMALAGGALVPSSLRHAVERVCKGYMIEYEIEGDATVLADSALVSAIDNIVRNALVHGQATKIEAEIKRAGDRWNLSIVDNGKGIPGGIKNEIFEEGFSYGANAGSGFGLFLVRKTMQRYGGSISVDDNNPRGAVFVLGFPVVEYAGSSSED
ncbi:MAG: response regulator [Methanomassiliicoccales archaeon]